jgi:hypothetical protein
MVEEIEPVSKQYQELFHYTTGDAFRSIYESQQFWATHYAYMNDGSEFRVFGPMVTECIKPVIHRIVSERIQHEVAGIDALVCREAAMHLDILYRQTFGERAFCETFITSFCAHEPHSYEAENGLLSQWRGYGPGAGVAIVLDRTAIEELMEHESRTFAHPVYHIGDVTYDHDPDLKDKPEFRAVFERLPEVLDKFYKREQPPYECIFTSFVIGTTLVKHRAFREETEVRIVVAPTPTNQKSFFFSNQSNRRSIECRRRGDSEVRYIKLFGNEPLLIKRVIVGPSRAQNVNYKTIKDVVSGSGIEVIQSETPFLE